MMGKIAPQSRKREGVTIQVVIDKEMAWEAGPSKLGLRPASIPVLLVDQVLDASAHGVRVVVARIHEAYQRPPGLRRRADSFAFELGILIGLAAFSPAAVGVLDRPDPINRFANPRFVHITADISQPTKDDAGAIQIVHAPSAVPATLRLLLALQELNCAVDNLAVHGIMCPAKHLKNPSGQVGGWRVYHGFQVAISDFV